MTLRVDGVDVLGAGALPLRFDQVPDPHIDFDLIHKMVVLVTLKHSCSRFHRDESSEVH